MRIVPAVTLAVAASAVPIPAQPARPLPLDLVPIHTRAPDAASGHYGTWAAGPDYKVSFGAEVAFYPVLGREAPRSLPLRWRTEAILVGAQPWADASNGVPTWHDDWRFELRRGAVTEAYDVLEEGVEQTFVLHEAPGPGALRIVGRLTTDLDAPPRSARHGALSFADDRGRAIVDYGAAIAFDAAGRRTSMTTAWDGERVTLGLSAAWLADATYPVVVDPLLASNVVATGADPVVSTSTVRNPATHVSLIAYSRSVSRLDDDLYIRTANDGYTQSVLVFTDLNASYSSGHAQCAMAGGANAYVVVHQRSSSTGSAVIAHVMAANNPANYTVVPIPTPRGASDRAPSVGGNSGTSPRMTAHALVSWSRTDASGAVQVWAAGIDALTGTLRTPVAIQPSPGVQQEPCVNRWSDGSGPWLVAWMERSNARTPYAVYARQVFGSGQLGSTVSIGAARNPSMHHTYPLVAGQGGRYLFAWTEATNSGAGTPSFGDHVAVQRVDWPETSGARPSLKLERAIATSRTGGTLWLGSTRGIAYDRDTQSHWTLAYRDTTDDVGVVRVGYSGGVVERDNLADAYDPSVEYNPTSHEYQLVAAAAGGTNTLLGQRWLYMTTALANGYGTGCIGRIIANNRGPVAAPFAGSEFFSVELRRGATNQPTALYVAGAAGRPLPISAGCTLHLPLAGMVLAAAGSADPSGNFAVPVPLPDVPLVTGDAYWQFFQLVSGQIRSTSGLHTAVH